jgi:hypothetical protein
MLKVRICINVIQKKNRQQTAHHKLSYLSYVVQVHEETIS